MILVLLLFVLEKIQITQRWSKSNQHGDDGDKSTGSVSDILFKHGFNCYTTNLDLSGELLNEI